MQFVTQLKRVLVRFAVDTGCKTRCSREFFSRISSNKVKKLNPDLVVQYTPRWQGNNFVEVEYLSGKVDRIYTNEITVQQLLEKINSEAEALETAALLKKAGLSDVSLESHWQEAVGEETEKGQARVVPIVRAS